MLTFHSYVVQCGEVRYLVYYPHAVVLLPFVISASASSSIALITYPPGIEKVSLPPSMTCIRLQLTEYGYWISSVALVTPFVWSVLYEIIAVISCRWGVMDRYLLATCDIGDVIWQDTAQLS
ncbi:hypothetical protein GGR50DRAFT_679453, partial [Xylaria sp. CBS 124048]